MVLFSSRPSASRGHLLVFAALLCTVLGAVVLAPHSSLVAASGRYVGSESCNDCHPDEYESFQKYARKAHTSESVKLMASDLTEEELESCFRCHATGYGQPGGFVSFEETPDMADAGCEVCHGPGFDHVDSGGDPELIKGDLTVDDCASCHNDPKVRNIRYRPMLYSGGHQ